MTDISRFITIEGIDGAGKTTFIPKIEEFLKARGEQVVLTREPGGTVLGELLREEILNTKMDLKTELLLAFASRREHICNVIRPNLEEGKIVLSDRFTDSTYAYQGYAKGACLDELAFLEKMVQEEIKPSLTLIFTVPVEVSQERLARTNKIPDKFESAGELFFLRAIEGYAARAKEDPDRCKLIDSSKGIENTAKEVLRHLEEYFNKLDLVEKNKNNHTLKR